MRDNGATGSLALAWLASLTIATVAAAQSAAVPRSALRSKSELRIWSTGPVRYSDQRARLMEVRHDTLVATICAGVPEECIVRPVALADVDSMLVCTKAMAPVVASSSVGLWESPLWAWAG